MVSISNYIINDILEKKELVVSVILFCKVFLLLLYVYVWKPIYLIVAFIIWLAIIIYLSNGIFLLYLFSICSKSTPGFIRIGYANRLIAQYSRAVFFHCIIISAKFFIVKNENLFFAIAYSSVVLIKWQNFRFIFFTKAVFRLLIFSLIIFLQNMLNK